MAATNTTAIDIDRPRTAPVLSPCTAYIKAVAITTSMIAVRVERDMEIVVDSLYNSIKDRNVCIRPNCVPGIKVIPSEASRSIKNATRTTKLRDLFGKSENTLPQYGKIFTSG